MRKRSQVVPLVVIGTLMLSGCGVENADIETNDSVETSQNYYSSKEECEQDWGTTDCNKVEVENVTTHTDQSGNVVVANAGSSHAWVSPRYFWDNAIQKPVALYENGATRVMENNSIMNSPTRMNTGNSHISSRISRSTSHMASRSSISRGGFGGRSGSFGG